MKARFQTVILLAVVACMVAACRMDGQADMDAAHNKITKIRIAQFGSALEEYAKKYGSFPTDEQGLEALLQDKNGFFNLFEAVPLDPWRRPYYYRNPGVHNPGPYDLWSNGKDGIEGTEDDITNWK
jgi:general secretion pathway protein G